jgi:hypothetical protein
MEFDHKPHALDLTAKRGAEPSVAAETSAGEVVAAEQVVHDASATAYTRWLADMREEIAPDFHDRGIARSAGTEALKPPATSRQVIEVTCPACGTVNRITASIGVKVHTCSNCRRQLPMPG